MYFGHSPTNDSMPTTKTQDSGSNSSQGGDFNEGAPFTEIHLDHEVLNTLCRRGRRRLRDMQTSCQAMLRLDRVRGVLCVVGPPSSVEAVRHHIASLGGPRRVVSAAVWAELMRTRTQTSSNAAVVRLQSESGCRIHIERSRNEVRIFGPAENRAIAERLLEELEEACSGINVYTRTARFSVRAMHLVAISCGVTLGNENMGYVTVFGLRDAVACAVEILETLVSNAEDAGGIEFTAQMVEATGILHGLPNRVDALALDQDLAESELTRDGLVGIPPPSAPTHGANGAKLVGIPQLCRPPNQNQPKQGPFVDRRMPKANPQGGDRNPQHMHHNHGVCPTCGSAPFCAYCGMAHVRCAEFEVPHDESPIQVLQPWGMDADGTQRQWVLMPFDMSQMGKANVIQGNMAMQHGIPQGMTQAIMIPAQFAQWTHHQPRNPVE